MRLLKEPDLDFTRGGVLVPTMGALHAGHARLIELAVEHGPGPCVVSVFVNPSQFNEQTDFDRYPRVLDEDLALCERAGADAVLAPSVEVVYPDGPKAAAVPLPPIATEPGLEDLYRPGHFAGVAMVVSRLFDLIDPSGAVFGEKDWQQLQLARELSAVRTRPIEIIPAPTVRESDGLAMSSRNRHLDAGARRQAAAICAAMREASNAPDPASGERVMRSVLEAAEIEPEYAVIRAADTLVGTDSPALRALVAAFVGGVRLIDNAPWPMPIDNRSGSIRS